EWLRAHTLGWGKVGYVYSTFEYSRKVVSWLGDWRNHANVESWMLYNLVLALQRHGGEDEALEVIRHAVAMRHWQDLFEVFRSWAAFEEAVRGNMAQAERHLAAVPVASTNDYAKCFRVMAQLLVDCSKTLPPEERITSRMVRQRLKATFQNRHPYLGDACTKSAYHRFIRKASGQLGTGVRLWGWWYFNFFPALHVG
ncbi:MAG TPA: hypothetical protein VK850_15835, partial [Candidatus Binatia bacterium]|nr:hypothetical protein [Candidatus Binatia bacterium]